MRDWDEHRLILAIYRGGSLRVAAEQLGVTHTTVARRLAALDAGQANPVFRRQGRSYRLTDYGRDRVKLAVQIEALDFAAQRLKRASRDGLEGPISLSVPRPFLIHTDLLDVLGGFADHHPGIELTIGVSDRLADLDKGQADVVLRGQIGPDPHLVGRRIAPIHLNYYARRNYRDTTPVDDYRWITGPQAQNGMQASPFPSAPIYLRIDGFISRYKAVSDGLGIGRLACFMADPNPELVRIGDSAPFHAYDLWILTHPDLKDTPRVKALTDWLWDNLKDRQALFTGDG